MKQRFGSWVTVLFLLMMLPCVVLASENDIAICPENFPDAAFRTYLSETVDEDRNGSLSPDERNLRYDMDVSGLSIRDLTGLAYFPNLERLSCWNNQLTSLDLQSLAQLSEIYCSNNLLTELNIRQNTKLTALSCGYNQLTSLDPTHNPLLVWLICNNNQLSSLDVCKNPALRILQCEQNQLTALDLRQNTQLTDLNCYGNQLTTLDTRNSPSIRELVCYGNQLTSLTFAGGSELVTLSCCQNRLTTLDVTNNPALSILDCSTNQLTQLDVRQNTQLTSLWCAQNQLTGLDVRRNTELIYLMCYDNQLSCLDVRSNLKLTTLDCHNNPLTSLNLDHQTALDSFMTWENAAYVLLDRNRSLDLATLPDNFDVTRASNWEDCSVSGTILTAALNAWKVSYDYDCGSGYTVHFTLYVISTPAKADRIVNTVSGVHVYWGQPYYFTIYPAAGFHKYGLWRSETGKNGTYKWIANPSVEHFTDTKVESGKTYWYKISAMNKDGTHTDGSEPIGITYTATPDISLRVNRASGIGLGWKKIPGATGYAIYRKSYAGNDPWVRIATIQGGDTLSWDDTSVKNNNGTVYRYTIRALYGTTLSGCRNTGRTMVRLTSRTLSGVSAPAKGSAKVTWSTTSQATGYEIRFMVDGKVYRVFTIGNYKTGTKTFAGLPAGTYKIQVRSYKAVPGVGSFYSAWSAAKQLTVK